MPMQLLSDSLGTLLSVFPILRSPYKSPGTMLGEAQSHGGSYLGSPVNNFTQVQPLGHRGPGVRMRVQKLAEHSSSQSVK